MPQEACLSCEQRHHATHAQLPRLTPRRLTPPLLHSPLAGGHYYAFIRPDGASWYRFDDERVTREEARAAVEEQYGGDDDTPPLGAGGGLNAPYAPAGGGGGFKLSKLSNAYMLVYVRVSQWDDVMCAVGAEDIPAYLRERLEVRWGGGQGRRDQPWGWGWGGRPWCRRVTACRRVTPASGTWFGTAWKAQPATSTFSFQNPACPQVEQREKEARQRAKAEAHLYCSVRLARDVDMGAQVGKDVWFDLVDYDKLPEASSLRVRKHTKFGELKQLVAEQLGVPVDRQRYWTWTKRQNATVRLADTTLGPEHDDTSLMDLRDHVDIVGGLWGGWVGGLGRDRCGAGDAGVWHVAGHLAASCLGAGAGGSPAGLALPTYGLNAARPPPPHPPQLRSSPRTRPSTLCWTCASTWRPPGQTPPRPSTSPRATRCCCSSSTTTPRQSRCASSATSTPPRQRA